MLLQYFLGNKIFIQNRLFFGMITENDNRIVQKNLKIFGNYTHIIQSLTQINRVIY